MDPRKPAEWSWQTRVSHMFFLLILLRAPFFDLPCSGIRCKTPLDIVVTELHAYGRAPHTFLRCLLYPGDLVRSFQETISGKPFRLPEWSRGLEPLDTVIAKDPYAQSFPTSWEDFKDQDIDLIGGSFLVVAGGFMAAAGPSAGGTVGLSALAFYAMRQSWDGIEVRFSVLFLLAFFCSLAWIPMVNAKKKVEAQAEAKDGKKSEGKVVDGGREGRRRKVKAKAKAH